IIGFDTTNVATSSIQNNGVEVASTAGSFNSIGDDQLNAGNFISGNTTGVHVAGGGNQFIYNNFVGTDTSGLNAIPNFNGIVLSNGANGNTVGGSSPFTSNLISGNTNFGVHIEGVSSSFNQI